MPQNVEATEVAPPEQAEDKPAIETITGPNVEEARKTEVVDDRPKKKIIAPLDTVDSKPSIDELLAKEEAAEAVRADALGAASSANEQAEIEDQISSFVNQEDETPEAPASGTTITPGELPNEINPNDIAL